MRSHVFGEILKCRQVLSRSAGQIVFPAESIPCCRFCCPIFEKDTFTQVPDLLQTRIRSARVFVYLLKKKIEKRFGQFEAIRHVAPLVFVDRFLAPWIEFPGAEGVIHFEKYLRGRDDHAHLGAIRRMQHPHRYRVICIRPEQSDASHPGALNQKGKKGGKFIAFRGGRWGQR